MADRDRRTGDRAHPGSGKPGAVPASKGPSGIGPGKVRDFTLAQGNKPASPELYDSVAESIAKTLIQPGERGEPTGVKRHQFRRIFDEVKRHLRTVEGSPERWDEVLPLIKMVKSKTAYAVARAKTQSRRDAAYYENLYQFVSRGIDQVSTLAEYRSLCLLMEAVYGFYYQLGGAQTD